MKQQYTTKIKVYKEITLIINAIDEHDALDIAEMHIIEDYCKDGFEHEVDFRSAHDQRR